MVFIAVPPIALHFQFMQKPVAYAAMPSPSSSLASSPSQNVNVFQYIDNEALDSTSSIDSNDRGN
jgi:hypothetical protein